MVKMKCHGRVMLVCVFTVLVAFADEPTVTDVTAKQRYPWNGLVDISCKVVGIEGAAKYEFDMQAMSPDSGDIIHISRFWVVKDGTNLTDFVIRTNGDYQIVWDAKAGLGMVRYTNMVVRVTVNELHGEVQLWEGGPHWAETNIGAEEPWDSGYYFWWGDTIGYKRENNVWVASNGLSSNFLFDTGNAPTCNKGFETLQSEGWITSDYVLAPEHDAAHIQWGGRWRLPTYQELNNLSNYCDWTWTTTNGVNGYVVRGRGDFVSDSIFLPASDYVVGAKLNSDSSSVVVGRYWSSAPCPDNNSRAGLLEFGSSWHGKYYLVRYLGQTIRPVKGSKNGE